MTAHAADVQVAGAIERGLAWLAAKQADDGGWHSEAYGSLRGGAAVTALVLYSAAHASEAARADWRKHFEAGFAFLAKGIDEHGCPRNHDGSVDYPTYAAALLLTADERLGRKLARDVRQRLAGYLLAMQIDEGRGFATGDPHHGGWELTGDVEMRGVTTGTNMSITCYALEALAAEKTEAADTARRQARAWLARCQHRNGDGDGGFFFFPERQNDSNKAQWADDEHQRPRSYGSTTADGLRALVYSGVKESDAAVVAAAAWLAKHERLDAVPGFEQSAEGLGWPQALRFYYYATLAKTIAWLREKDRKARRGKLGEHVLMLQKEDGRWQNEAHHMREDDPLIATALAMTAMAAK